MPLFSSNVDSASFVATTSADPQLDAVQTIYTSGYTSNIWFRYHTSGSPYTVVANPSINGNYLRFPAQKSGGNYSFCGVFQKLSGLIVGDEYFIDITVPYSTTAGTFRVKRYFRSGSNLIESTDSTSFTMPYSTSSMTASFTATTATDVILFDFSTESTSAVNQDVYSISIRGKKEYLSTMYATDKWNNAYKVLRRNLGNRQSDD